MSSTVEGLESSKTTMVSLVKINKKLKNKQTKTVMVSLVKIKQINKQTKQQDNNGRNPYNAKSTK